MLWNFTTRILWQNGNWENKKLKIRKCVRNNFCVCWRWIYPESQKLIIKRHFIGWTLYQACLLKNFVLLAKKLSAAAAIVLLFIITQDQFWFYNAYLLCVVFMLAFEMSRDMPLLKIFVVDYFELLQLPTTS